jgi:hypothetical protein
MTELGRFEARLLGELKQLVPAPAAPAPRRRRPRSAVLAAALAGLAAAGAGAAGLSHALRADPHKAGLARTVAAGGHVGPRVAASGPFSLYASSDDRDVEIDYSESPGNGWSAVTRLPSRAPIVARALSDRPPNAVYGRVAIAGAAIELRYADGRAVRFRPGLRGFFVSAVPRHEDPARATLVVRDGAGRTIARRPLSR